MAVAQTIVGVMEELFQMLGRLRDLAGIGAHHRLLHELVGPHLALQAGGAEDLLLGLRELAGCVPQAAAAG
eukprot:CAMPEP_0183462742 /NCGR_PEP_ID=MMETSP0370-20130417/142253_1 /TAXON_ID=268820 /ORGANISM="Peridinium aciculiferum, Strain PAER-2" /LENGTH=70 /DNA_ID=CAMNT_0025654793 /DNA_START=36 /DNA_END=245 /DNA_ORIENTATION=+